MHQYMIKFEISMPFVSKASDDKCRLSLDPRLSIMDSTMYATIQSSKFLFSKSISLGEYLVVNRGKSTYSFRADEIYNLIDKDKNYTIIESKLEHTDKRPSRKDAEDEMKKLLDQYLFLKTLTL